MIQSLCRKKDFCGASLLYAFTDIHAHLLPGVDDGIRSREEALEALDYFERAGVSKIWCTPHVMQEMRNNNREYLLGKFMELCRSYSGKVQLALAAEYMLDEGFAAHLQNGLLVFPGNRVLVETSCQGPLAGLEQMIFGIRSRGYEIILAHPERYLYMQERDYEYLARQGVRFQLSFLSLWGMYGKNVQKRAVHLLEADRYDFAGSDLHNLQLFRLLLGENIPSRKHADRLRRLMTVPAFL